MVRGVATTDAQEKAKCGNVRRLQQGTRSSWRKNNASWSSGVNGPGGYERCVRNAISPDNRI
eukprot:5858826-Prorocentrum_lima.AAC.1